MTLHKLAHLIYESDISKKIKQHILNIIKWMTHGS